MKRPTARQTGESCVTVKTTRAGRGSTKVSVVVRRFFGPLVAIHVRDESKCLTRAGRDAPPLERAEELPEEEAEDEEEEEALPKTVAPTIGA